jgi:para-nitrobenzyl esterase
MRTLLLLLGYVLLSLAQSNLLVQTVEGPVLGFTTSANKKWLGIPYAQPPLGNLRWQPPRPTSWTSVFNASTYGKYCPQTRQQTPLVNPEDWDEDCLTLDVISPLGATESSNLPVYVYIYGGAWHQGYTKKYEGSFIAGQDVVVVAMNYRLGIFGLLASPVLLAHAPEGTTGMYSIQDQRAALEWVQRNIRKFGGNPQKVTIGGQSAGGGMGCVHAVAPRSAGLFNQWIMQSGFCQGVYTKASGYRTGANLINRLGCNKTTDQATRDCLVALPAQSIVDIQNVIQPTMDDYEGIYDTPYNMIYQGAPLNFERAIIGNTLNETGQYQCPTRANMTPEQYNATLQSSYPTNWQDVYAAYPVNEFQTPVSAYIAVTTDTQYAACSSKGTLDGLDRVHPTKKIWGYSYEHYPRSNGYPNLDRFCVGSGHTFDLYSLYPSYAVNWPGNALPDADEQVLANQFRAAWVSFIINGEPVLPNGLEWPEYTFKNGEYAIFELDSIRIEDGLKTRSCPVWGFANPVCSSGVAIVARPGSSWSSNGLNNQIYDVKATNTGNLKISNIKVQITPGSQAYISQSWNLNQVSNNIYSLPDWYQAYALNGTSSDAGFVLTTPDVLAPSVQLSTITC